MKVAYQLTQPFPKSEMFGLSSQIRRSAVSIPTNIAEGYARKHRAEYTQFVRIAYGSGAELETLLDIVDDLEFAKRVDISEARTRLDEVMRMLNKMISSLVAKP